MSSTFTSLTDLNRFGSTIPDQRKEMSPQRPRAKPPSLAQLRRRLSEALKRESVDFQQVAELSAALVALDPEVVRFTVDAALVSRLGLELVGKQETAVAAR